MYLHGLLPVQQRSMYEVAPVGWGGAGVGGHNEKAVSNLMHVCGLSTWKNKDSAKARERDVPCSTDKKIVVSP